MIVHLTVRQRVIVNSLMKEETMTAQAFALILDVSVRTIKNDIRELKEKLTKEGVQLLSKTNKGYYFEDPLRAKKLLSEETQTLPYSSGIVRSAASYSRVKHILQRLMDTQDFLKFEDLADELFVSRSTLNQDMRMVKRIVGKYDLSFESKPNYGVILRGKERHKRLCISEYLYHGFNEDTDNDRNFDENIIETMEEILREACIEYAIEISDFGYRNIALHMHIAVERSRAGEMIWFSSDELEELKMNSKYGVIGSIRCGLHDKLGIMLSDMEEAYVFMHIDAKQIIDESEFAKRETDSLLYDTISEILEEIKNNFNLDISNDKQLRTYLSLHIPQMIKRVRTRMVARNPIIHENLRNYLYATKVTISAVAIIEKNYKVSINLDEFGYLVLYFQMALLNVQTQKAINIGIVSTRGRSESIMYKNALEANFSSPMYQIRTYENVENAIRSPENIHVLVTTTGKHNREGFPYQVVIEEGNYIEKVRNLTRRLDLFRINKEKYFTPEYFLSNIQGKNKSEILDNILGQLVSMKVIPENSTPRGKTFISHELGNGVVHLQDLYKLIRTPICMVVMLDEPVLWDKSLIQVLILIKTKRDGDKDLFILCDMFSKLVSDKNKVKRLIEENNFEQFMEDIYDY